VRVGQQLLQPGHIRRVRKQALLASDRDALLQRPGVLRLRRAALAGPLHRLLDQRSD